MRTVVRFYFINTSISAIFFLGLTLLGPEPKQQDWAADILAFVFFGWFLGWFLRRAIVGVYTSSFEAKISMTELNSKAPIRHAEPVALDSQRDIDD
jgi:hypothetical protein